MRVFLLSLSAVALIATGSAVILLSLHRSAAVAFSTSAARI
jgi:hypothetical protein